MWTTRSQIPSFLECNILRNAEVCVALYQIGDTNHTLFSGAFALPSTNHFFRRNSGRAALIDGFYRPRCPQKVRVPLKQHIHVDGGFILECAMFFLLEGHITSQVVHKEDVRAPAAQTKQISSNGCVERLMGRH